MISKELREEMVELRKQGLSYRFISEKTGASKSSVGNAVRHIILSGSQKLTLNERRVSTARSNLQKSHAKRKALVDAAREAGKSRGRLRMQHLSDPLFFIGIGLYWGEGLKKGNQEVGIVNSDLKILKTMIAWFEKYFDIRKDRFACRLTLNTSQAPNTERHLAFWSEQLGLDRSQFTKTSYSTSKSEYSGEYEGSYHGVLRIKISKPLGIKEEILEAIAYMK